MNCSHGKKNVFYWPGTGGGVQTGKSNTDDQTGSKKEDDQFLFGNGGQVLLRKSNGAWG